jgi:protein involved in polysaccharide export with SLBB domain
MKPRIQQLTRTVARILVAGSLAAAAAPRLAAQTSRPNAQNARPKAIRTIDDFKPGDRIVLRVDGEKDLTDTFTVRDGPVIELPSIGRVSLAGVGRTDIEPYLKGQLGQYLKSPIIRARALVRVGLLGELGKPGYYNLPADALLSDALTDAGGPTKDARMAKATVMRAGVGIVKSDSLDRAIAAGLTIGQLGLRSGDDLVIPRTGDPEHVWRIIAILVTIPAAIFTVVALRR